MPIRSVPQLPSSRLRLGKQRNQTPKKQPQKKIPKRAVSADRDNSYFNILGTEDLVSTERLLADLDLAKCNSAITKLELEDVICRNSDHYSVTGAVAEGILNHDNDRKWNYIKFTDGIRSDELDDHGCPCANNQLTTYEEKQHKLWNLFKERVIYNTASRKPVSFQVKLELDAGSSIESLLKIFRRLQSSRLGSVEFGGGLYGYQQTSVPDKLVTLLQKRDAPDDDHQGFVLDEMIMMQLIYSPPDMVSGDNAGIITECIMKMVGLVAASEELEETAPAPTKISKDDSDLQKMRNENRRKNKADKDCLSSTCYEKRKPRAKRKVRRCSSLPGDVSAQKLLRQDTPDFRWDKMANYQIIPRLASGPAA